MVTEPNADGFWGSYTLLADGAGQAGTALSLEPLAGASLPEVLTQMGVGGART